MNSPFPVELTAEAPETLHAELLAVPFAGTASALLRPYSQTGAGASGST